MSRGKLTDAVKDFANLQWCVNSNDFDLRALRLLPYIQYCVMNEARIDQAKINDDDRYWLTRWTDEGRINWHAPHIEVTKDFWDVMEINTNSKGWSIRDFINSWIVLDKPDYRILRNFIERYGLSATIAASMLRGYVNLRGGGDTARLIKSGDFKVASESFAEVMANQIVQLRPYAEFEPATDRELICALMKLSNNDMFDFSRLISKMKLHGLKLQKRPSEKYYILHVEELYNHHNSITTELYKSTYDSQS